MRNMFNQFFRLFAGNVTTEVSNTNPRLFKILPYAFRKIATVISFLFEKLENKRMMPSAENKTNEGDKEKYFLSCYENQMTKGLKDILNREF